MEELQKVLKQIEDLKTLNDNFGDLYSEGWQGALHNIESWVKSRMSAIYRNSDKRPY